MSNLSINHSSKVTTKDLRNKILYDIRSAEKNSFLSFLLGYIDAPHSLSDRDLIFRPKDSEIENIITKKLQEYRIEHLWNGEDNRITIFSNQINEWFNNQKSSEEKIRMYKNFLRGSFYARGFILLDGTKFHRIEFSCHGNFSKSILEKEVFNTYEISFSKNKLEKKLVFSIRQRNSIIDILVFLGFESLALVVTENVMLADEERSSRWKSNVEINNEVKKMDASLKQINDIKNLPKSVWNKQDNITKEAWKARLDNPDMSLEELTVYLNKNFNEKLNKSKVYRIIKRASVYREKS